MRVRTRNIIVFLGLIRQKNEEELHEFDLCYTHLTKHSVKLVSNIPFKEGPRKILPPMVDQVQAHLKEAGHWFDRELKRPLFFQCHLGQEA